MSISNVDRTRIIETVNGALGGLPEVIRSVSADLADDQLRLQFIYHADLDPVETCQLDAIEARVAQALPGVQVTRETMRVDAPGIYFEALLPIVILAMFEQNEDAH